MYKINYPRIGVYGASGYIGGGLTDLLCANSIPFKAFDSIVFERDYLKPNIDFFNLDVRDDKGLLKSLEDLDVVVWLVAVVGDGASNVNPEVTLQINYERVQFLRKNFNGKIIFISSASVYGMGSDDVLTEQSPVNPLSLYADSKKISEEMLKDSNCAIIRLGTLHGVSDNYSRCRLDLVVNSLTANAFFNKRIFVTSGRQFRPLLHVRDISKVICDYLVSDKAKTPAYDGIFNVAAQNCQLIDIAHQVRAHFPECEIEQTELPTEDCRNYKINSDRAKKYLNFKPQYTVDDSILQLKYLFETGRIKNWTDSNYHNHRFFKDKFSKIDLRFPVSEETKRQLRGMKTTSVV